MKKRVLLVEDSQSLAAVYQSYLDEKGLFIAHVETGKEAMIRILQSPPDLLILDLKLPDMNGMDVLRHIKENGVPTQVIVITAHGSVDIAVDAMQNGAFDFLVKPFDGKRLVVTVQNALEHGALTKEVASYRDTFARNHYEGFIGESLPMQSVYRIIDSAAPSNATVFITGESGTGKEVCADAIHRRSSRSKKAFVPLNCGAIPRDLMESEIFGHAKGAFTGAQSSRDGAATLADGGTLFLDEICEMDLDLQTKLLRFIQTGTFQKVGASKLEHVDVRFICATNRDPWVEVQEGRFREDLYYRLHVIPIELPPLRARETDIKLIMDHFLRTYSREEGKLFTEFSVKATEMMMDYDWPGNVRQLQNIVRNIVVLNNAPVVDESIIPPPVRPVSPSPSRAQAKAGAVPVTPVEVPRAEMLSSAVDAIKPLWLIEKETIEKAIALCDGNIPKAAALLEVSASTIYRKREKWLDG
ncbi:response regulator receiver-modulated signal transduction sigma54/Fis family transcriptional regulator [Oleiphilus messinensis]|uniref:Response regulator receiver-modulated signal transduction sigma54/Fis family transcriptional regulator n=1 Tax=Oleiphilus messinensis TaxID=141451 RepID=A0A1Y0I429_9GAMM|nr:sigma-54 dependent transcriptional regulator [Oleiphilus messinensis]ARU55237.1 response regulator receiver-modulated signal transduction sigma54/Fis family transcriptional regulator [Oleiphilus messinensis]